VAVVESVMIELLIEREGGVARTVRLREGVFVLGRADTADIVLDDSEVSRRHARLLVDDGDVVVEDLGTQNGTWVGGERVEQLPLQDGDVIEIHPFTITVEFGVVPVQPARTWLEIVDGPGTGTTFELHGDQLGVGRSDDQAIRLPDQSASRAHAVVFRTGDTWSIRDNHSVNGITVNDRKVGEMELQPGDVIGVGATALKLFHVEPPPQAPRAPRARPAPPSARLAPATVAPPAPPRPVEVARVASPSAQPGVHWTIYAMGGVVVLVVVAALVLGAG